MNRLSGQLVFAPNRPFKITLRDDDGSVFEVIGTCQLTYKPFTSPLGKTVFQRGYYIKGYLLNTNQTEGEPIEIWIRDDKFPDALVETAWWDPPPTPRRKSRRS